MKHFLIIIPVIFYLTNLLAQPAGYSFGKQITIDPSRVSGPIPLTNFPVLISVTDNDLRTTANGGSVENPNGFDIIFSSNDCSNLLSHDLEHYNPSTGELVVWVKLPLLNNNTNTRFLIFYGNSLVSTNQSSSDIWTDAGYDGVWHLHNDFTDASGNANNGINNGSTDLSPAHNSADGQNFVDPNHWIELPNHPARLGSFSYSGWARTSDNSRTGQRVICDDQSNGSGCHAISIGDPGPGRIRLFIRGMAPITLDSPPGTILNDTWYYVAATFNGSTNLGSLYVDGQLVNSATYIGSLGNAPGNASIGGEVATGETQNRFQGDLDEIRANNTVLSADWFATEYNNQNSPNTFYSFSEMQVNAASLCSALPIELLTFEATITNSNSVTLNWQTASEINNDFFTIERSKDGFLWEETEQIKGAGNSSIVLSYFSIDHAPYSGLSFYRLKQTDFDGKYDYSNVKSINIQPSYNSIIKIYPNPVIDKFTLTGSKIELNQIKILNNLGQNVTNHAKMTTNYDKSSVIVDITQLSSGMYYVKTKTITSKVFKK